MRPPISRLLLAAAVAVSTAGSAAGEERVMAVTIDDLPAPPAGVISNDAAAVRENTRKLLDAFRAQGVPAVGFVNESNNAYAAVYADALRRGDRETAAKVGADYPRYMDTVFAFVEEVSRSLLGREVRQILLLHANALNADFFGRLAEVVKARGYRFISLEEALQDEAYRLPDDYVGAWGISWLHHWELTAGRKRSPSPDPPAWVTTTYQALQR